MQAEDGQESTSVIDQLLEHPSSFSFFQAVTLLLRYYDQRPPAGRDPLSARIRFGSSISLGFPASEIEALDWGPSTGDSLEKKNLTENTATLITAFTGLLGISGTLPLEYTERIGRLPSTDRQLARDFLDLLATPLVRAFYSAWNHYRIEHKAGQDTQDDYLGILTAIAGVCLNPVRPASDRARFAGYYAGLVGTQTLSASTLEAVLSNHFGVPIEIEEFVGSWDFLAPSARSTLGRTAPRLGYSATAGFRQWRHDRNVRIHVGPLDREGIQRFLKHGVAACELADILKMFSIPTLQFEVALSQKPGCIEAFELRSSGRGRQLGYDTVLMTRPFTHPRRISYRLNIV